MANKFNFDRVKRNLDRVKKQVPTILANQAQNFFVESWKKQGWDDNGVKQWAVPKRRVPGTPEYEYPKKRGLSRRVKPTLVKTGRLRRAVSHSIRQKTFNTIKLAVDVPYAQYHNEGTNRLPKRQFMGDSRTLRKMQLLTIYKEIDFIWQA